MAKFACILLALCAAQVAQSASLLPEIDRTMLALKTARTGVVVAQTGLAAVENGSKGTVKAAAGASNLVTGTVTAANKGAANAGTSVVSGTKAVNDGILNGVRTVSNMVPIDGVKNLSNRVLDTVQGATNATSARLTSTITGAEERIQTRVDGVKTATEERAKKAEDRIENTVKWPRRILKASKLGLDAAIFAKNLLG